MDNKKRCIFNASIIVEYDEDEVFPPTFASVMAHFERLGVKINDQGWDNRFIMEIPHNNDF